MFVVCVYEYEEHIKIFLYKHLILCEIVRWYAHFFKRKIIRYLVIMGAGGWTFQALLDMWIIQAAKQFLIRERPYLLMRPLLNPWENVSRIIIINILWWLNTRNFSWIKLLLEINLEKVVLPLRYDPLKWIASYWISSVNQALSDEIVYSNLMRTFFTMICIFVISIKFQI